MSRSQSSWDEIATEGVKLSNTALDQWHGLVDQAKLSTADDATREEKFAALQNIVQSNPQQYPFLGESYFTLLDGEIKTKQQELTTLSKGSAALAPHVKEFSQIAQAASIFAGLVSRKAAQGLDKVATGGFMLHSSLKEIAASGASVATAGTSVVATSGSSIAASGTSVATSGSMFGPTALCVAAVVLIGQGLYDLVVVSDDPEPSNHLALAFQEVIAGLLQISQQINHLGKYIEGRFNQLEEFLHDQHHETLHQLHLVLFHNKLNATEIKALIRSQNSQNKDMIQAFSALHRDVIAFHQTETDSRSRNHMSMLTELHYLQTQPGFDLVNSVRQSLSRKTPIDEAKFKEQSAALCRIITTHGSASLAGGDLLDDRALMQSRLLNPISKSRSPEEIIQFAYRNPELLKIVAIENQALPATQNTLPNLVFFKDRLLAFYDWHRAYAEVNNNSIPQDALSDLQEVTRTLSNINQHFLQDIDMKTLFSALLDELKQHYACVQEDVKTVIEEFSVTETKGILSKRLAALQTQTPEELFSLTKCDVVTEGNKIFDFTLNLDAAYPPKRQRDTPIMPVICGTGAVISYRAVSIVDKLSALPVRQHVMAINSNYHCRANPSPTISPTDHTPTYSSFDYKKFFVDVMPFAPQALQEENARNPINWDEQLVDHDKLIAERKRNHLAVVENYRIQSRAFQLRLLQLQSDQAAIDLFNPDNSFESLESILVIGPRMVKSENTDIPFYLCLADGTALEKFIPTSILVAELLGLGELHFTFNAGLFDAEKHTQQFRFEMKVQFTPAETGIPILLFMNSFTKTVSSCYKDVVGLAYDYWYGNLVYDGGLFDLTCLEFKHNNPIHRRSCLQTALNILQTVEKNDRRYDKAQAFGSQLTAAHLHALRIKSNESLGRFLQHPSHALSSGVFQLEVTAAYIQLFSGLLMPQYLDDVRFALLNISFLVRSNYKHCLSNANRALLLELSENKMVFDDEAPRILSIVEEALNRNHQQNILLGDRALHQLQKQLVEYAEKVTVSATPVASTSSADVDALRAVIVEQSKQIAELTISHAESTKQLNAKIDGLTAMIEKLLTQQTAQLPQVSQGATSGPRLFGVV